jgi:hypothetical protein
LLRAIDSAAEDLDGPACIDRVSAENPGSEAAIGRLIERGLLKVTPDGKQFRITRAGRREKLGWKALA